MNATIARRFRGASAGYLLIAPAVIVTVVFLLIPMIVSGYWSLTHYNGIRAPEFVGLQNYADVLSNARFQRAFQNTVFFVIMGMSIGPVLGLGSALLLNDNLRLRALFRTAFFLPTMTSLIVVATIWKFMYADNGIINAIAGFFGLPGVPWLNDPTAALPAVVVTATLRIHIPIAGRVVGKDDGTAGRSLRLGAEACGVKAEKRMVVPGGPGTLTIRAGSIGSRRQ